MCWWFLSIGGKNRQGYHTISLPLHDTTFEHSTGVHHCASTLSYLYDSFPHDIPLLSDEYNKIELLGSYVPYKLLIDADGGCDLCFNLQNKVAVLHSS